MNKWMKRIELIGLMDEWTEKIKEYKKWKEFINKPMNEWKG